MIGGSLSDYVLVLIFAITKAGITSHFAMGSCNWLWALQQWLAWRFKSIAYLKFENGPCMGKTTILQITLLVNFCFVFGFQNPYKKKVLTQINNYLNKQLDKYFIWTTLCLKIMNKFNCLLLHARVLWQSKRVCLHA